MKAVFKVGVFCCTLLAAACAPTENLRETKEYKNDTSISSDVLKENINRLAARAERAEPAEYPYYASIQVSGQHHCGGALISGTHVLSAAHCVYPVLKNPALAKKFTIEVGSVEIGQGTTHYAKRLSYHRDYIHLSQASQYIQPNDVAVITLTTPVAGSEHVKFINLPSPGFELPDNAQVKVAGFGNARLGGPTSRVLQKSDLYIVSHTECDNYFSSLLQKNILSDSQICAKGGHGYGACQGDSGGPMVYNRQVVGLVSAGDGMCGAGNPDIYTKVSSFLTYIQSEMNGGDDSLSIALDIEGKVGRSEPPNKGDSQYPTAQNQYYPIPGQYPSLGQFPINQYPAAQYPIQQQDPETKKTNIQYYPVIGQYPSTSSYPVVQYPMNQYPIAQYPIQQQDPETKKTNIQYYPVIGQYPSTGYYPVVQYPMNQYPIAQYPIQQNPETNKANVQYHPVIGQYPSQGIYPVSQYPVSQYPVRQYPDRQYLQQISGQSINYPTVGQGIYHAEVPTGKSPNNDTPENIEKKSYTNDESRIKASSSHSHENQNSEETQSEDNSSDESSSKTTIIDSSQNQNTEKSPNVEQTVTNPTVELKYRFEENL